MTSIKDLIKRSNKAKEKALNYDLEPTFYGVIDFILALVRVILFISLSATFFLVGAGLLIYFLYTFEFIIEGNFREILYFKLILETISKSILIIIYIYILRKNYYQKSVNLINLIRR